MMAGAVALLADGSAMASGFMVRENSAESVATVFAGNASRADDVATVFNNPAGMSKLPGTELEVGSALVLPGIHFSGTLATATGTPLPGDNHRQMGQVALVPHFYAVTDLDERTKLGLAITAPFGNTLDYGTAWSGRYLNIKTAALALDINPNISYALNDWLTVAGGFSLQYLKLELSSGIPQSLIFGPSAADGKFALDAANWNWGYNLGLLAEPLPGTRLGLTYRSAVGHKLKGVLRFSPETSPLLGFATAPAESPIDLPASTTASITQAVNDRFSLSSDVQFTQWHTFRQVLVQAPPNPTFNFQEKYRDSWMVSVGGVYQLDDAWSLRAGFGYDESPVVDAFRDTGVPDKDRLMIGFGPGIRLNDRMWLNLGYAHYFGSAASMDKSVNSIDPVAGTVLSGSYHNTLDYLAATYRVIL